MPVHARCPSTARLRIIRSTRPRSRVREPTLAAELRTRLPPGLSHFGARHNLKPLYRLSCGACGVEDHDWYTKKDKGCNWVAKKSKRCKSAKGKFTADKVKAAATEACPLTCGTREKPQSKGSCYSPQGYPAHSIVCDVDAEECGMMSGSTYPPGFISSYGNKCCHCHGSCTHSEENDGGDGCAMGFEWRDHFRYDHGATTPGAAKCVPTAYSSCEKRSAGSCLHNSVMTCDVSFDDCNGAWFEEGHVSDDGRGCCHCGAGCDHDDEATGECRDGVDYFDSMFNDACKPTTYNAECTAMDGESQPSPAPTLSPSAAPGSCTNCGSCYNTATHAQPCVETDEGCDYFYAPFACPDGVTCTGIDHEAAQACVAEFENCCVPEEPTCTNCGSCYNPTTHALSCVETNEGCDYFYSPFACPDGVDCTDENYEAAQACVADFENCCDDGTFVSFV